MNRASIAGLDLHALVATFALPLGDVPRAPALAAAITGEGVAHVEGDPEPLRAAVRDLLRQGGFRPSGRNKPASEYLARAELPIINVAVDAGNAVSKHGGLPVSVIDLDRTRGALRVAIAPAGTTYPFNPSGQIFDASGLVCLFDDEGVTATPVKDAQRTKTDASTTRVLALVWGVAAAPAHGVRVRDGFAALLAALGADLRAL